MIRSAACVAALALLAATGCAPAQTQENEEYKAPVYRTGSNLPAGRESGQAPSRELSAAERRALEDLQNRTRQPIGQTK